MNKPTAWPGKAHTVQCFILAITSMLMLGLNLLPATAGAATFGNIVTNFHGYDYDRDGVDEIEKLQFLWNRDRAFDAPNDPVSTEGKLVVVLVESRLLNTLTGSRYSVSNLLSCLARLGQDLAMEGRQARFLEMKDYDGTSIQDGKTVLAMREFFKSVYWNFSNFEGAILVGSFPDAGVVRTWISYPPDTGGNFYNVGVTSGKPRPHDIVLADLDGNWQNLYHQNSLSITGWTFQITNTTIVRSNGSTVLLTNSVVKSNPTTRRDFFWVKDANYTVFSTAKGQVQLDLACASPEANAGDKLRANPVARPEICISRINPRFVAVQPPSSRLLDANGIPQAVPNSPFIDMMSTAWTQDPALERTLLIEYLNANHAFRAGRYASQGFSVSVAWCDIQTWAADEGLVGMTSRDSDTHAPYLPDYVQWLKHPTLFRCVAAHSNDKNTYFPGTRPSPNPVDYAALEAACGGHPWYWIETNSMYVPTLRPFFFAGFNVYRTLWENKVLTNVPPSLMVHVGCNVAGMDFGDLTHNSMQYAHMQNAGSILFYARQLAILCRVTDWNHGPFGFGTAFNASPLSTMGDGWKGVSAYLSQDTSWYSTQKKQSYIWDLLGDYTLQKFYAARAGNDEWPGAIALTANVPYSMSTTNATSVGDPTPSCIGAPANGVWFTFTPKTSQVVSATTCGSDFDTVLEAFTYSGGTLVPVYDGCSDDGDVCGSQSHVTFPATAGTPYYLMAGGYNGLQGNLTITVREVPLVITRQPAGGTRNAGDAFLMGVLATGNDLGYQWQRGGLNLAGANASMLSLTNLNPSMAGEYRVIVTNSLGSLTSAVVTLTVQAALPLALEATNLTWTTGGGENSYGWFRQTDVSHDGTDSAECGATDTRLPYSTAWMQTTVTGPATVGFFWKFFKSFASRSGDYLGVFVDGVYQSSTASPFSSFSHQNVYVGAGSHTVKWQYVRSGMVHGGGPGYVDEVTVEPGATPAFIATQPASTTTIAGSSATFTVAAAGTPPFTYQWQFNGANIGGATNSTLLLTNVQPIQAGNYTVLVANGYGTAVPSSIATLAVTTIPLPAALDYAGPLYGTTGNACWFGQVGSTWDGADAAQSGWTTNSQQTTLTLQLTGPGNLSFWWRVSSETNRDTLGFYTNGILKTNISGEVAWRKQTFALVPGMQTLAWRYSKDSSVSRGQDAGWVDQVSFDGRPYLSLTAHSQAETVLSWPTSVIGSTLQMTTNLQATIVWQSVTNPAVVVDDNWTVTNTSTGIQQFYRLRK